MTAIAQRVVARAGNRRRRRGDSGAALAFLTPSAAGLTVFILFPSILAIVTSLFHWPTYGEISFAGVDNYAQLFTPRSDFGPALLNTVLFTVLIVPINLVLTISVAFWVASSRFRQLYRVLFFIPVVTPSVATAIIWKLLYQPGGVLSWLAGLFGMSPPNFLGSTSSALISVVVVILWNGFGYNMLIFSAAIDQLPEDVLAAAALDGAGPVRTLFRMKLPLMTPAIFFATTVTLIQSFQIFNEPYVMTAGGPGTSTITVVMNVYQTAFQSGQLGQAAAPAIVLFALILIVTLVQWAGQKKWVHYE
jgi:multiple sugar transport system permease protein